MVLKSIITKIDPINSNEKCFYEAISKTKSVELDSRSLIFSFIDDSTSYPEAVTLAESALTWAEELELSYIKFESKAQCIGIVDEKHFHDYCLRKKWKIKKNSKDLIARENSKFKARFELNSKKVFMIIEKDKPLELIQILNEFGEK